ncbi:MAG: hypothetical protein ATN31_03795 [Candidatus Epulonipiscioides saccharophilum]|nr:MAG: hypothetical protein ATN31_03795 [Epulopiscium sp. AS2M-Bin001]
MKNNKNIDYQNIIKILDQRRLNNIKEQRKLPPKSNDTINSGNLTKMLSHDCNGQRNRIL